MMLVHKLNGLLLYLRHKIDHTCCAHMCACKRESVDPTVLRRLNSSGSPLVVKDHLLHNRQVELIQRGVVALHR